MHTSYKAKPHLYQPLKKLNSLSLKGSLSRIQPQTHMNRMPATQIPSFPFPCNLQLSRSYLCRWWKQSEIRLIPSTSPPLFLKVQVRDDRESVIINSFLDSEQSQISIENTAAETTFIKTCSYTCQSEILEGNIYFFSVYRWYIIYKKLQTMHPFSAVSN